MCLLCVLRLRAKVARSIHAHTGGDAGPVVAVGGFICKPYSSQHRTSDDPEKAEEDAGIRIKNAEEMLADTKKVSAAVPPASAVPMHRHEPLRLMRASSRPCHS